MKTLAATTQSQLFPAWPIPSRVFATAALPLVLTPLLSLAPTYTLQPAVPWQRSRLPRPQPAVKQHCRACAQLAVCVRAARRTGQGCSAPTRTVKTLAATPALPSPVLSSSASMRRRPPPPPTSFILPPPPSFSAPTMPPPSLSLLLGSPRLAHPLLGRRDKRRRPAIHAATIHSLGEHEPPRNPTIG